MLAIPLAELSVVELRVPSALKTFAVLVGLGVVAYGVFVIYALSGVYD